MYSRYKFVYDHTEGGYLCKNGCWSVRVVFLPSKVSLRGTQITKSQNSPSKGRFFKDFLGKFLKNQRKIFENREHFCTKVSLSLSFKRSGPHIPSTRKPQYPPGSYVGIVFNYCYLNGYLYFTNRSIEIDCDCLENQLFT